MKADKTALNLITRVFLTVYGLIYAALGEFLMVRANVGIGSWQTLNIGISGKFNLPYGTVSIITSVLIIVTDVVLKENIGIGTILDAVLYGVLYGVYEKFFYLPAFESPVLTAVTNYLLLITGMTVEIIGMYVYIGQGLSCGPRDLFLVGIGKKLKKLKIGLVNIIINAVVLVLGLLLGAKIGFGTAIYIFGYGVIMQIVFSALKFEPRFIRNESLYESYLSVKGPLSTKKQLKPLI